MQLLVPLDEATETRFGSATSDLAQASSVLRALASRRGMVLSDASDIDLAAAVIGADAWMALTSANGFKRAHRYGQAATDAFCAVLLRAAGCGSRAEVFDDGVTTRDDLIALADGYRRWASATLGTDGAAEALRRAAADLGAAARDANFESFAGLLLVVADTAEIEG